MTAPPAIAALAFTLDGARYAVPIGRVVEVLPRVRITALPGAPPHVVGVIRHRGAVRVVVDLRARLGHPARAPSVDDHLIVARAARRTVALLVDRATDPCEVTPAPAAELAVRSAHVLGVAQTADGVLVLQDLDAVLSLDDDRAVDRALEALEPPP